MVPITISRSVNEPPLEARDSIGMCTMVSVSQPEVLSIGSILKFWRSPKTGA